MHEPRRAHDAAAERLAERLVAEAHAEQRHVGRQRADELEADAGLVGVPGPGEITIARRPQRERLVHA